MTIKIPCYKPVITIFILVLCAGTLNAETIFVSGIQNRHGMNIVKRGQLLEDPSRVMDITAVRQTKGGWIRPSANALNFGYSSSAYWMVWEIENDTLRAVDLIVDLGNPREDYVTWHVLRTGKALSNATTGDRRPFTQRPFILARNFTLPLSLSSQERVTVYVNLQSHDGFFEPMPVTLHHMQDFLKDSDRQDLILTLYHGGLIFLLLYNFLLYLSTRQLSFALYAIYLLFLASWNLTMNGYFFQYLWPDAPVFNNHFLTFCSAGAFGTFGLFTVEYLTLHPYRQLARMIRAIACLNFAVVIPSALDHYAFSVAYGQIMGIIMMVVTLGTGIRILIQGQRQARFYMAAFTMLACGATIYIFKIIAWIPTNLFTAWALQAGSSFEVLILALGLADAMNILKQEKLDAERKTREAHETLAIGLERQVRQRTRELEFANQQLESLAITDELTGAYNRRHFNTICTAALSRNNRDAPLAFCMFDIDFFKRYNDTYGHAAGDDALQRISSAVLKELKRSGDSLFRLGGEEFGVLFTALSRKHAFEFADTLRRTIQALQIPHEGNRDGVMTASFGVSFWDSHEDVTPEQIYAQTDEALYRSKNTGRNKVNGLTPS